ncbi:MAG: hypothetical protein AB7R55_02310 [Gemmatimonadales bacterium]
MRNRFSLLVLLVIGGCSSLSPSDLLLPSGALPVAAPATYKAWFGRTEACSGLNGRFEAIEWYVVPGVESFPTAAGPKVGMWERSGAVARIIVAGAYQDHEMVVRHEMLHHLLDREGHPSDYFVSRCHLTWESWETTQAGD